MISRSEKNEKIIKDIKEEDTKKNVKKYSIILFKIIGVLALILIPSFIFMRYIATKGLIVKEYALYYETLPDSFNGIKVLQFSDLNYGSTVFKKEVELLINKLNEIKPDIVIFTGDLIANNYEISKEESEYLIEQFQSIQTTIGKYAIAGDKDGDTFYKILNSTDFKILDNDYDLIYYEGLEPLLLIGINNNPDLNKSFHYYELEGNNKNIFNIVLTHMPDTISAIKESYNPNLVLAGHSLGGSIRLPFIGCLNRSTGYKKYCNPHYQVGDTDLYISSGIGTLDLKFRLLNRPSINLFRIRKK